MRHAIIEKLLPIMNETPSAETEVVYALVEIRKILEHAEQDDQMCRVLRLFIDWALHVELDRSNARRILMILDERLRRFDAGRPETIDPDHQIHRILSLDLFRRSLIEFLARNDLPLLWGEDENAWRQFVMLYGQVICDAPLVMTRENVGFEYLRRLMVAGIDYSDTGYTLKWEFTLDSGRSFTMPFIYARARH